VSNDIYCYRLYRKLKSGFLMDYNCSILGEIAITVELKKLSPLASLA